MTSKWIGQRTLYIIVWIGLLAGSLGVNFNPGNWTARTAVAQQIFLPFVSKSRYSQTIFGYEHYDLLPNQGIELMSKANASWVRRNALAWSTVEPTQGAARSWDSTLDQELINAAAQGQRVILIIRSTPTWAQQVAGYFCGPVRADALPAFANFMQDVVKRYSVAPYYIKYYELGNEPDVLPAMVTADSQFGCWGANDAYYGGEYYGQMLKVVYPAIKAANPAAQVVVGGLLLDCNPDLAGSCASDSRPPRFLEGILISGAANAFDGIAFHAYDYYNNTGLGQYASANWGTAWNTNGPSLNAKAAFLNATLARYNVTGKFLMNTEDGLLNVATSSCDANCEATKAYYVPQAYVGALKNQLRVNIWYSLFGWRFSGLASSRDSVLPAYNAYVAARNQLGHATYTKEITSFPNVRVYEFSRADGSVWVAWSLDGGNHVVDLPGMPLAVRDVFGASTSYAGGPLTIGIAPIYIEWNP